MLSWVCQHCQQLSRAAVFPRVTLRAVQILVAVGMILVKPVIASSRAAGARGPTPRGGARLPAPPHGEAAGGCNITHGHATLASEHSTAHSRKQVLFLRNGWWCRSGPVYALPVSGRALAVGSSAAPGIVELARSPRRRQIAKIAG